MPKKAPPQITVSLRHAHHLHSLSRTLKDLRPILALEAPTIVTLDLTPERNSGYGLALTRFLMEMNDGRLIVWSGEGRVQFGGRRIEKQVADMPGTI